MFSLYFQYYLCDASAQNLRRPYAKFIGADGVFDLGPFIRIAAAVSRATQITSRLFVWTHTDNDHIVDEEEMVDGNQGGLLAAVSISTNGDSPADFIS